jgi:DNA polymerase I-like protein with 3'-5' exonuclease and polymerase domains
MSVAWKPLSELPDLGRVKIIALDIETSDNGLRGDRGSSWPWGDGYICGLSAAYHAEGGIRAHYFPIAHPETNNFDSDHVFSWLRHLIESGVRIVTQNGVYDFGWLGIEADIGMPSSDRLEEIGAMAALVDENRFTYGLDDLCKWRGLPGKDTSLLEEKAKALAPPRKKTINVAEYIHQLPAEFVGPYAEGDAAATLAIYDNLNPILDHEGMRNAYRLEVDLLPMVLAMRRRGIRIDQGAAEQARDLILRKRDLALGELSGLLDVRLGMKEIKSRKWLEKTFNKHKIRYPRTEKGNPSFTAGKLGWMVTYSHPLPQLIARASYLDDKATKFLQGHIIEHIVNGRIHAEINPHRSDDGGTRSSRFSYSNPPLQQMPKRDAELAVLIRGVFLPEEGEVWAEPDVSQQEFRFCLHYALERNLPRAKEAAELYANPDADFHQMVADMTGLPRDDAKAVNFAKIYGAGPEKFAEMIGKPRGEADAIRERYDRELPFMRKLSQLCAGEAERVGYTVLYDGARRHWNLFMAKARGAAPCSLEEAQRRRKDSGHPWHRKQIHRCDTYTALNALVQGSSARHTKLWMRAVYRAGIIPLLQMHDALPCSVSSREQAELVARLGEEAISLKVPMTVGLKFGRSWGDAKHTWAEMHGLPPETPKPSLEIKTVPEPDKSDAPEESEHEAETRPPTEEIGSQDMLPSEFLAEHFGTAIGSIYICSLPNERGNGQPAEIVGRGGGNRLDKLVLNTWDREDRGTFFCVATVQPKQTRRSKDTLCEIVCLHLDIDLEKIDLDAAAVLALLKQLALPPSRIVNSGHGLHAYWLLREPLQATPETIFRVEHLLKKLADMLGGDPAVCEVSRIMRLPGSHNTKRGDRLPVEVIVNRLARYKLDVLAEWIAATRVLISRKSEEKEVLAAAGIISNTGGEPIDVPARLMAMQFQGRGGSSIHTTQLACTAAMLSRGAGIDEVVAPVLTATRRAAGAVGERWNWKEEEREIRAMCETWQRKKTNSQKQASRGNARKRIPIEGLGSMEFSPTRCLVPDLIPAEGVTLICSKPKVGKSWLLYDLCLSCGIPRDILGGLTPLHGSALYLALEDSLRRLKDRAEKLIPAWEHVAWPANVEAATEWSRVDQGGLDDIRDWVQEVRATGAAVACVAIDVLQMIRPAGIGPDRKQAYTRDYEALQGLRALAAELHIAILVAHHTRKMTSDDLLDMVSGTQGLSGAADTVIVIERQTSGGFVFDIRGRDIEPAQLATAFDKETCRWTIAGDAGFVRRSAEREAVLTVFREAAKGGVCDLDTEFVTAALDVGVTNSRFAVTTTPTPVRQILARMAQNGDLRRVKRGAYALKILPDLN